jgi:membrane protease YdiL (CAAX protease family)
LAQLTTPGSLPGSGPLLGFLVAGFVLLVIGLAALTVRRHGRPSLSSATSTRRAVAWAVVYGLCAACFARVIQPALLGRDRSPWLLALGDVICVTLSLFVWVMALAEGHRFADYGFRARSAGQLAFFTLLAIAPLGLYLAPHVTLLLNGRAHITTDALVFASVFAALGSALPEELLFRGYLMGSLGRRSQHWARILLPAMAFAAVRSVRYLPGQGLTPAAWAFYLFGMVLPLGVWWGVVRDLAGGSLWPSLIANAAVEFVTVLATTSGAPGR